MSIILHAEIIVLNHQIEVLDYEIAELKLRDAVTGEDNCQRRQMLIHERGVALRLFDMAYDFLEEVMQAS